MLWDYLPTTANADNTTPHEARTGKQGSGKHLLRFGAAVQVKQMQKRDTGKSKPRSRAGVYVGYNPHNDSSYIYCTPTASKRGSLRESNHFNIDDKRIPPDPLSGGEIPIWSPVDEDDDVAALRNHPRLVEAAKRATRNKTTIPILTPNNQGVGEIVITRKQAGKETYTPETGGVDGWEDDADGTPEGAADDGTHDSNTDTGADGDAIGGGAFELELEDPLGDAGLKRKQKREKSAATPNKKRKPATGPAAGEQTPPTAARKSRRQRNLPTAAALLAFAVVTSAGKMLGTAADGLRVSHAQPSQDSLSEFIGKSYSNYKKASADLGAHMCDTAFDTELHALQERGMKVIRKADVPRGQKIQRTVCVYVLKPDGAGGWTKLKARITCDGSQMEADKTDKATHQPTWTSIRTLCACAALDGRTVRQNDLPSAYLVSDESKDAVYAYFPPGKKAYNEQGEELVIYTEQNWYGLPTAGRTFENCLARWLTAPRPGQSTGHTQEKAARGGGGAKRQRKAYDPTYQRRGPPFKRSLADPAVFTCGTPGSADYVQYTHWVDDGIYFGNGAAVQRFEQDMNLRFGDCKPRDATHVLGLTVSQRPGEIHLSMPSTIDKMVERFLPGTRQTAHVPINAHEPIDLLDCHTEGEEPTYPYREAAGSVIWASVTCRPDIAYAIGQLTRVQARPGKKHWAQLKQLLCYLRDTKNHGITYRRTGNKEPRAYVDASFADTPGRIHPGADPNGRKSTGGHVIELAGGAVSYSSSGQPVVALSTTESELIEAVRATRDIIFVRKLLFTMERACTTPTVLLEDNNPVIKLMEDAITAANKRSRHIELRWFWLREAITNGIVELVKVASADNVADIMTKGLYKPTFTGLRDKLVAPPPSV